MRIAEKRREDLEGSGRENDRWRRVRKREIRGKEW